MAERFGVETRCSGLAENRALDGSMPPYKFSLPAGPQPSPPVPIFSLPKAAELDIGALADVAKLIQFVDAWRSGANEIPIRGKPGSQLREQELRLRATVVERQMVGIGKGADSIAAIINTVKHLSGQTMLGDAMLEPPPIPPPHVHLVPPDAACAVCGNHTLELMPSSKRPAKLSVRGLDGTRPGTAYKKVCKEEGCGAVHLYNEIHVPPGMRLLTDAPHEESAPASSAEALSPAAKRRCFRPDVLEQPFWRASTKTVYTTEFMNWTTALLESTQVSFDGMARTARAVHREDDGILDRLYRKNLTTAWFAREGLIACHEAKLLVPSPAELGIAARRRSSAERRQKITLRRITALYRSHFRTTNLHGHNKRCTKPGRCRTAALDGIHNLTTFKCKTQHRHYLRLGRWGQLPLGCTNPPAPRSAYCEECLEMGGLRTPDVTDPEFTMAVARDTAAMATAMTAMAGDDTAVADVAAAAGAATVMAPGLQVAPLAPVLQVPQARATEAAEAAEGASGGAVCAPSQPPSDGDIALTPSPVRKIAVGILGMAIGVESHPARSVRTTTQAARVAFQARFATAGETFGHRGHGKAAAVRPKEPEPNESDESDQSAGEDELPDEADSDDEDEEEEKEVDEDAVDTFEARYLENSAGRAHEPIKKDVYLVEHIEAETTDPLGVRLVKVKWIGWKHPTWEPRENISPVVLSAYDNGQPYGKSKYDELSAPQTGEILELSQLELELFGSKKSCNTHKQEQKRWSKVSMLLAALQPSSCPSRHALTLPTPSLGLHSTPTQI